MTNPATTAERIIERQLEIAHLVTNMHFEKKPELETKYGNTGREKTIQDVISHISYLAEAIRFESQEIFSSYIEWTNSVLESRKVPTTILIDNLNFLDKGCKQSLRNEDNEVTTAYLTKGVHRLQNAKPFPVSYLTDENPFVDIAKQYLTLLLKGNRKDAQILILELIKDSSTIPLIFENIFQVTQYEVGLLWQTNKITVAHEHYCTASTQQIISSLYRYIFSSKKKGVKMIACTISGDLHELGIRMISDTFELDGWETYYLGANMPDVNILSSIKEQKADLLALSVTMPFHLDRAAKLIEKIRNDADFDKLKIILGGYTFNIDQTLWKRLGADGMACNSYDAVLLANQLIKNH
jgi:methanogenic corrinoid protein MtbC1